MPNDKDFEVRNEKIEQLIREIGHKLKRGMPPGWGFTLFLSDFHKDTDPDKGSLFYVSSCNQEDMIKTLKEFIKKQETQCENPSIRSSYSKTN